MADQGWGLHDDYLLYLEQSGIALKLSPQGRPQCQFCDHELFQSMEPSAAWSTVINDRAMARDTYRFCPNCKRDLMEPNFGQTADVMISIEGFPHLYHTFCEHAPEGLANTHNGEFEVLNSGEGIEVNWTDTAIGNQRISLRFRRELAIILRDRLNEILE